MIPALLVSCATATVVSAILTACVIPLLRRAQVLDIPVGRSLHTQPVPRGGGLAVVLTTALTVAVPPILVARWDVLEHVATRFDVIIVGTAAILAYACVGLWEDLYSLSARTRFALQIVLGGVLGLATALETGASIALILPAALCSAALVNITNFMDGANGLVSVHALVGCLWYTVLAIVYPVPGLGFVTIVLGGACLGFLPFNALHARVFLGDSGSYGLGGAWAFAACMSLAQGVPFIVATAPLLVLVADTGYTLWMRIRAGQRWYEPHKLHVYQRLVSAGWSHQGVAGLVAGTALLCCLVCVPALTEPVWSIGCALACLVVLVGYVRLPALVGSPNPFRTVRRNA